MRKGIRYLVLLIAFAVFVNLLFGAEPKKEELELTIYNQNFALIKEKRWLYLKKGIQSVQFSDIPKTLEPTSVRMRLLKSVGKCVIREQKYVNDNLYWQLETDEDGGYLVETSYLSGRIDWFAAYNICVDEKEKFADLNAWASIQNQCGVNFDKAKIKLMAGEIHRERKPGREYAQIELEKKIALTPSFVETSFSEYHLFTLKRPISIGNNETKQIELIDTPGIPIEKQYIYNGSLLVYRGREIYEKEFGTECNKKVRTYLKFKNVKDANLGIPLPPGTIRAYKSDLEGGLQYLGEELIPYTSPKEEVKIFVGNASDLAGKRTQTNYRKYKKSRTVEGLKSTYDICEETFKIVLKNRKDKDVIITVLESLYRGREWEIIETSQKYEKIDANTIQYEVKIPKDSKRVVTYTVRYF